MNANESRRLWQSGRHADTNPIGPNWNPILSTAMILGGLTIILGLVWKLLS